MLQNLSYISQLFVIKHFNYEVVKLIYISYGTTCCMFLCKKEVNFKVQLYDLMPRIVKTTKSLS